MGLETLWRSWLFGHDFLISRADPVDSFLSRSHTPGLISLSSCTPNWLTLGGTCHTGWFASAVEKEEPRGSPEEGEEGGSPDELLMVGHSDALALTLSLCPALQTVMANPTRSTDNWRLIDSDSVAIPSHSRPSSHSCAHTSDLRVASGWKWHPLLPALPVTDRGSAIWRDCHSIRDDRGGRLALLLKTFSFACE